MQELELGRRGEVRDGVRGGSVSRAWVFPPVGDGVGTAAHRVQIALFHRVLLEVARRRAASLPGLVDALHDGVVVTAGGATTPGALRNTQETEGSETGETS